MATIDMRGATLSAADPPIGTNPNPDLAIKAPVRVATTGGNITLSGLQTIDGVALAAGDRVLVKDQTDATTNGIYNASTGNWTRTIDANNNSQWAQGTQVGVATGTINAGSNFRVTSANPIVLGTTALAFLQVAQFANPAQFAAFFQSTLGTSPQLNQFDTGVSSWVPVTNLFGSLLRVIAARSGVLGGNAIVGATIQDMPGTVPANQSFPTGGTGYVSLTSAGAGNTGFGLFGRADIAANGAVCNELNCNNSFADSPANYPPDLSFSHGTGIYDNAYALGLQIVNIGVFKAHSALRFAATGGAKFRAGLYIDPTAVADYGFFSDATSSNGPGIGALLRGTGSSTPLVMQTVGAQVSGNPILYHQNINGTPYTTFQVNQNGTIIANANTAAVIAPPAGTTLQISGADGAINQITLDVFGSVAAIGARRADGTAGSRSAIGAANEQILNIGGLGWDGSVYGSAAGVVFFSGNAFSGTDHSGYTDFKTTAVGSTSYLSKIRIQPSGGLTVSNPNITTDPGLGGIFADVAAGIGTNTLTSAFLALAAGTTAKSQINFAASTAPASPNNGDWWFDGTNLNIRISGSTKTITHS